MKILLKMLKQYSTPQLRSKETFTNRQKQKINQADER